MFTRCQDLFWALGARPCGIGLRTELCNRVESRQRHVFAETWSLTAMVLPSSGEGLWIIDAWELVNQAETNRIQFWSHTKHTHSEGEKKSMYKRQNCKALEVAMGQIVLWSIEGFLIKISYTEHRKHTPQRKILTNIFIWHPCATSLDTSPDPGPAVSKHTFYFLSQHYKCYFSFLNSSPLRISS